MVQLIIKQDGVQIHNSVWGFQEDAETHYVLIAQEGDEVSYTTVEDVLAQESNEEEGL